MKHTLKNNLLVIQLIIGITLGIVASQVYNTIDINRKLDQIITQHYEIMILNNSHSSYKQTTNNKELQ